MKRREFISLLAGGAMAWPVTARAQSKAGLRRVGILMPFPASDVGFQARVHAFRQELLRLGWSEGTNIEFNERWSTDNMDAIRVDAAGLVTLHPDVVLIVSDRAIPVFTKLTSSIPIVVAGTSDPIASGAADSLARPGHNVTGFSLIEFSMFGKMLEILKLIAPAISRVGIIYNPDNSVAATYLRWFEASAGQLGVQPVSLPIRDATSIELAFASMAEQPNGAVLTAPDLTANIHRNLITALAARHRLPAVYTNPLFADAGGLVAYGPNTLEMFRQAASYVDRILRGEKAGDLPFQQPTTYRLVINLKTANALGVTVPPTLLAQADEVIE